MRVDAQVRLADGDHVVHFYHSTENAVPLVAGYLTAALGDGDALVVIATSNHRSRFVRSMVEAGVDVRAVEAAGRIQLLDADETLSQFMIGGAPDCAAFDAVVGRAVRAAGDGGRRVRAYGEMVALLWSEGNLNAAIELEKLWNGLAGQAPFALLCGYPASALGTREAAYAFAELCQVHSDVFAAAPLPDSFDEARRFPCNAHAPQVARQFVAQTLSSWKMPFVVDDAVAVVAELAANAVIHARSDFTVALSRTPKCVQLIVGDSNRDTPTPCHRRKDEAGGRGLLLVDSIAQNWGHETREDGKVVWVQLDLAKIGARKEGTTV